MEKEFDYFKNIIISYFQGTKTEQEIRNIKDFPFKIEKLSQWSDFIGDFETSLRNYNEDYYFYWQEYKEYAKDTAPTVKGLIHSLNELINKKISLEEFINWACWHNVDCGETTSGIFENRSIEFFCLFFIPEKYKELELSFYKNVIPLIEKSNKITYGKFIISLYMFLKKEERSLYYFLKSYLENSKDENDLEKYLKKKFDRNLNNFRFELSDFPYLEELNQCRNQKLNIDEFWNIMSNLVS